MPHTSSAKKRLRQIAKRNTRNRYVKQGIKLQIKKFLAALKAGDAAAKTTEFNLAVKKLDKAAARKIIHANKAARLKSQLAKRLAAPAPAAKPAKV
jgi:small subunit ribosomal protein S20